MSYFLVIDTETTWTDKVMSIGIVVSNESFEPIFKRYYILYPECKTGGMFSKTLNTVETDLTFNCSRESALNNIYSILTHFRISTIFAYNARFDHLHLPEFNKFKWYDIMKIASNRNYNKYIGEDEECYGTGRLKSGYGVESILKKILKSKYKESHNALQDSIDELEIMKHLQINLDTYLSVAGIN